jgi:hypothetical protein
MAVLSAAPAHASYTASLAGSTATFAGNGASDALAFDSSGGLLRHNRPTSEGFNSDFDFSTTDPGDQTLSATNPSVGLIVNAGGGNDTMTIGTAATPASAMSPSYFFSGQGDTDSLVVDDSTDAVARSVDVFSTLIPGISMDGAFSLSHSDVESVSIALGSGADRLRMLGSVAATQHSVAMGDGNDIVDLSPERRLLSAVAGPVAVDAGAGVDIVTFDDAAEPAAQGYTVSSTALTRPSLPEYGFTAVEHGRLNAGSAGDTVTKSGAVPFTIDAGAGPDAVNTRDSVGDAVACLGGADTLTVDLADVAGPDCETIDRPAQPQPPVTPPVDTTAPTLTFGKLPKTITRKRLLRGVTVTLNTSEPALVAVEERAAARGARLARNYNLVLAQKSVPVVATRKVTLKASKRVVGKSKRFSVRLSATATDAAGNRSAPVTRTIKVRR